MSLAGRHIVLDLYNCRYDILSDRAKMQTLIKDLVAGNSLEPQFVHTQSNAGSSDFSLVAFFKHGHIIVHARPDLGFSAIDIFSGLDSSLLDKIAMKIKQSLYAEKVKITLLRRGDFGSLSDMKPITNKNGKTWRRVRNTSAKVWKIIVNNHKENRTRFPD